jgi:hypothetical protein
VDVLGQLAEAQLALAQLLERGGLGGVVRGVFDGWSPGHWVTHAPLWLGIALNG